MTIIDAAIARSIALNETVTLGTAFAPVQDAPAVMSALFARCADVANDDPRSVYAEYWGEVDGRSWRVHVWHR